MVCVGRKKPQGEDSGDRGEKSDIKVGVWGGNEDRGVGKGFGARVYKAVEQWQRVK